MAKRYKSVKELRFHTDLLGWWHGFRCWLRVLRELKRRKHGGEWVEE